MKQLEGRHVVITGGAGGIGSLVARRLRDRGAHVLGIDLVACPECDTSLQGDLSADAGQEQLAAALARQRVDVLVNLAGVQYFGPLERQPAQAVRLAYAVNLLAPTLLAQAVLPQMKSRGSGQIINVGSVFGAIPFAHFVTYSAAKGGLRAFSEALRRELADTGIEVTHIAPRAVRTRFNSAQVLRFAEMTRMHMDPPEEVAARIAATVGAPGANVVIGLPESLFVRVNALAPALVDRALRANDRKAATIFSEAGQGV